MNLADGWAGGACCQEEDMYLGLALFARQTSAGRSACVYHIVSGDKFWARRVFTVDSRNGGGVLQNKLVTDKAR